MTNQNIFSELGFSDEEAAILEMKFYLMESIREFVKRRKWTQVKAADFFGTTQPKISRLMNSDSRDYTVDRMIKMVARTGGTFNYSFRQPGKRIKKVAAKGLNVKTRKARPLPAKMKKAG